MSFKNTFKATSRSRTNLTAATPHKRSLRKLYTAGLASLLATATLAVGAVGATPVKAAGYLHEANAMSYCANELQPYINQWSASSGYGGSTWVTTGGSPNSKRISGSEIQVLVNFYTGYLTYDPASPAVYTGGRNNSVCTVYGSDANMYSNTSFNLYAGPLWSGAQVW